MSVPQRYAPGKLNYTDAKFALRFVTGNFIDPYSFDAVKKQNRAFNVYQWRNDLLGKDSKIYSGWVPWLHFAKKKWSKYDTEIQPGTLVGLPLLPSHKFFGNLNDFVKWLGESNYREFIADLL